MVEADRIKLTSFQRDSLYIIAGLSEPNGVTIKDELEAYYDTAIQAGRPLPGSASDTSWPDWSRFFSCWRLQYHYNGKRLTGVITKMN